MYFKYPLSLKPQESYLLLLYEPTTKPANHTECPIPITNLMKLRHKSLWNFSKHLNEPQRLSWYVHSAIWAANVVPLPFTVGTLWWYIKLHKNWISMTSALCWWKKLMNRSCVTQNQITMNSFNLRCIESGAAIQIVDTVVLSVQSEPDSNQSRIHTLYKESASI